MLSGRPVHRTAARHVSKRRATTRLRRRSKQRSHAPLSGIESSQLCCPRPARQRRRRPEPPAPLLIDPRASRGVTRNTGHGDSRARGWGAQCCRAGRDDGPHSPDGRCEWGMEAKGAGRRYSMALGPVLVQVLVPAREQG